MLLRSVVLVISTMSSTKNVLLGLLQLSCVLCHGSALMAPDRKVENATSQKFSIDWKCESNAVCTAIRSSCVNGQCICDNGYVYNNDLTACLKVASAFSDTCEETIQCSAYLYSGGYCTNNACRCAPGFHYLHGRCRESSGLFGWCLSDDECYVNADTEATSCIGYVCQCSPGFYQREYRTCRRAGYSVGDECTVDLDCVFSKNAICNSSFVCEMSKPTKERAIESVEDPALDYARDDAAAVGQNCTTDKDCESLGQAFCNPWKACACGRAHFPSSDNKSCIPELGEPCKRTDAVVIANSICRNGTWSCAKGTVSSIDKRICRKTSKRFGTSCLHDEQCYIFGPDAYCNETCLCNEKSHIVESELFCWTSKAIGERCQQDNDCYMKNVQSTLKCSNNKCSCPDGTHLNYNRTACIESSGDIGASCELDADCAVKNSKCPAGVCACANDYYESGGKCLPGINTMCRYDSDCTSKNARCQIGMCTCKMGFVYVDAGTCLPASSYWGECERDIQCSTKVPGAICGNMTSGEINASNSTPANTGICVCPDGYHYSFGRCYHKRLLGEPCESEGECYLRYDKHRVVCRNDECACDWRYSRVNEEECSSAAHGLLPGTYLAMLIVAANIWNLF